MRTRWKQLLVRGGIPIVAVLLLAQLLYPADRLPLFMTIDTQTVGWQPMEAATKLLDEKYARLTVPLYFGSSQHAYRTPAVADIGLTVTNKSRVEKSGYPFWLRLVPTSLFWAGAAVQPPKPEYMRSSGVLSAYIERELGASCSVAPKNPTFAVKNNALQLIPAIDGGRCELADVRSRLSSVEPRLSAAAGTRIPMKRIAPPISNEQARTFLEDLKKRTDKGVAVKVGEGTVTIEKNQLLGWLDFSDKDNKLAVHVNRDRSAQYFNATVAPKVSRAAGVSKVSTLDFTETSRVNGAMGQALDLDKTLSSIDEYLTNASNQPAAVTKVLQPRTEYTRSYSPTDTGLSALLKQYAEAHPGAYGISLIELGGRHRRATYQDDKVFQTASTYKLFIAYSSLKRVEAGTWHWGDQITGGRNLEKCLDDMIVKSDNACGEALLAKIGFRPITDEMKAIGLSGNTSFLKDVPQTTAGDLATFLGALQSGQLLSPDSTNRLLGMMKRNIYRQGVPAGTGSQVADKVGFLNGLFHDAAIIYGPDGPVILTVMTEGSNWATIADLTRQIEALRVR